MFLLSQKDMLAHKEALYRRQGGICPLCNNPLGPIENVSQLHLDHSHELNGDNAGRVRGLLHGNCNTLEGTLLHKFNRSGLKSETEWLTYLKNLVSYLERDFSNELVHPKFIPDSVKAFSRLTLSEMKSSELLRDTQVTSKKEAIRLYRSRLKSSLSATEEI